MATSLLRLTPFLSLIMLCACIPNVPPPDNYGGNGQASSAQNAPYPANNTNNYPANNYPTNNNPNSAAYPQPAPSSSSYPAQTQASYQQNGQNPTYGQNANNGQQPLWEAKTVTPHAQQVQGGTYSVQSGDTLRGIGNKTGAGSEAIARANGLVEPWVIYPGQQLIIPGGTYHDVEAGETGIAIARAYQVQWADMVAANGLEEPYILRIGQKLRIPDGGGYANIAPQNTNNGAPPPASQAIDLYGTRRAI